MAKTPGGKGETTGMIKAARLAFNGPVTPQQGNRQKISGSIRDLKKAIEIAKNVETRTSGLSGVSGKLGGQHAGGQGASLGGGIESNYGGGGGLNEVDK